MPDLITADYVIVGAGAMGMAFADVLLEETSASIAIVDKHHQPGGHWNDAYPYVRLHQPSAFYGVNSTPLGSNRIDTKGFNKGLYELASNEEVCAYFDGVMQQRFLPSGRVQYFPMSEFTGEGQIRSLVADATYDVGSKAKLVDATYMNVTVPSMRAPSYEVAAGVRCIPPNQLPKLRAPADGYTVVGAGKTGMDACLWLLSNGVTPDQIHWIMPRDSWMLDRANIQPGAAFAQNFLGGTARQTQAIAEATSIPDLFERMHTLGQLLRFDEQVKPTMYRCATVTQSELEALRSIENVIRLGKVTAITQTQIVLEQGTYPTAENRVHIDCSADGLEKRPPIPVFNGNKLTLQAVRTCQQVFSAAFIGHVEATYADDASKNELCQVVPHPDDDMDFLRTTLASSLNAARWAAEPGLARWLQQARLDGFSRDFAAEPPTESEQGFMEQLATHTPAAIANLQRLLAIDH